MMVLATSAAYIATSQEHDAVGSCGFRAPHRFRTRRGDGFRVVRRSRLCCARWGEMEEILLEARRGSPWPIDGVVRGCVLAVWRTTSVDGGALLCNVLGVVDDPGINDPALTLN